MRSQDDPLGPAVAPSQEKEMNQQRSSRDRRRRSAAKEIAMGAPRESPREHRRHLSFLVRLGEIYLVWRSFAYGYGYMVILSICF